MSPVSPLTPAQEAFIATRRAIADGGRVAADPVAGTSGTVMVSYRFGGRQQTRLVLADGYVAQGYSEPAGATRRRR